MRQFVETSLSDLYASAVNAFPRTTKRQYAIDPVEVKQLSWTPYRGIRTLLCRALIESNGHEYNALVLFKRVVFMPAPQPSLLEVVSDDGERHYLQQMFNDVTDVNVRCNCPDFRWRFRYYNFLDSSLYGSKGSPYFGSGDPANPHELPGLCKHLMKLMQNLNDSGYLI